MARPQTFDHDEARALLEAGHARRVVAQRFGVSTSTIHWLLRGDVARRRSWDGFTPRTNVRLLTALGVDGRKSTRAVEAAALSARVAALRARVRAVGPLCVDSPTVAAAHAAGLTLEDIHEVFAVPPVEAARAIAAHSGV